MGNLLSLECRQGLAFDDPSNAEPARSNLKCWLFEDNPDYGTCRVDSTLVDFSQLHGFRRDAVYVLLHVFVAGPEVTKRFKRPSTPPARPSSMTPPRNSTRSARAETPGPASVSGLVTSFADNISAAPVVTPLTAGRVARVAASPPRWVCYSIHVHQGHDASPFSIGMALAKVIQLNDILSGVDDGSYLPDLLRSPTAARLPSIIVDDTDNMTSTTRAAIAAFPLFETLFVRRTTDHLALPIIPIADFIGPRPPDRQPTSLTGSFSSMTNVGSLMSTQSPDLSNSPDMQFQLASVLLSTDNSLTDSESDSECPSESFFTADSPLDTRRSAIPTPELQETFRVRRMPSPKDIDDAPQSTRNLTSPVNTLPTNRITLHMESLEAVDVPEIERRKKVGRSDQICSRITDYLYLSSYTVAKDIDILSDCGITHILNMAGSVCPNEFPEELVYMTFCLRDGPGQQIEALLVECIDFIERARRDGGRVLVHCQLGVSRSTTIAIAHMMFASRTMYDETFRKIKSIRPIASPNTAFMCQLLHWQQRLQAGGYASEPTLFQLCRISIDDDTLTLVTDQRPGERCGVRHLDSRFVSVIATKAVVFMYVGSLIPDDLVKPHLARAGAILSLYQKYGLLPPIAKMVREEDVIHTDTAYPMLFHSLGLPSDAPTRPAADNEAGKISFVGSTDDEYFMTEWGRARRYGEDAVPRPTRPTPAPYDLDLATLPITHKVYSGRFESLFEEHGTEEPEPIQVATVAEPELFDITTADPTDPGESVVMFESDDLEDDGLFVLCPSAGYHVIYVWVGDDYVGDNAEDAGRRFVQARHLDARVVVVRQDAEPDQFWDFFANG